MIIDRKFPVSGYGVEYYTVKEALIDWQPELADWLNAQGDRLDEVHSMIEAYPDFADGPLNILTVSLPDNDLQVEQYFMLMDGPLVYKRIDGQPKTYTTLEANQMLMKLIEQAWLAPIMDKVDETGLACIISDVAGQLYIYND